MSHVYRPPADPDAASSARPTRDVAARRRRRLPMLLAATALSTVGAASVAGSAQAHGGENHGAGFGAGSAASTGGEVVRMRVAMNGLNEVDTVGSDGTATIRLRFNPSAGEACFSNLRLRDVLAEGEVAPTKLHLHAGVPSINGPVVVDFTDLAAQGKRRGCVSADPQLIQSIVNAPNSFYLNVHTATFPNGAVRGQLDDARNPEPIRNATTYEVTTSGAQEVGTAGSANGTGRFSVVLGDGRACVITRELKQVFEREDEFAPSALHIHRGAAGTNGDVVVDFTSEAAFGERVACVEVDQALIDRINANPANYYLNFHTFSFPKGAMRGQLA